MKQGPDEYQPLFPNDSDRFCFDDCILEGTRSSEEIEEECFDLIIGMMCKKQRVGPELRRRASKEFEARDAGGCFRGPCVAQLPQSLRVERKIELAADACYKIKVVLTFDSSQVVIQMAHDQFVEAQHSEQMKKHARIDST